MRVLHITSGNLYGGVEAFLATLLREASAAPGMDPEFAVCFDGRFSSELESLGCVPHRLAPARLSRPFSVLSARRALTDLLRRGSYDVVVCHQAWTCVLFASVIRSSGRPVVLWVHMAGNGRHWLERLCQWTRPDLALCNSRFTAECTSSWLVHTPIEYAYCPVAISRFSQSGDHRDSLRRSLQTPLDDVVLVQVSRLEAFKGQHLLLKALSTLRDYPRWTCWIVGGAQRAVELDYLRRLQALARDHGIADRVRFTGERSDVSGVLGAADVYCQPNTEPEGFGLTFVEAMRAGLPVVTTGIGGAAEIVDGACGVLIEPDNASALGHALRRLILDADLRARLGCSARGRSDELCNVPRQMRRIQAVLTTVVAPRLTRAPGIEASIR